MTEKETVTAREDQLGICNFAPGHLCEHRHLHKQSGNCIDWRPVATEDQPRPTPPDCQTGSNLITQPGKEITGEMTKVEARGEVPQPSPLVTGKPAREWGMTNKEQNARNLAEQIIALYHAVDPALRNQNYSAIVSEAMDLILEAGVETGAHPSQDALLISHDEARKLVRLGVGDDGTYLRLCQYIEQQRARSTPSLPAQDAQCESCAGFYAFAWEVQTFLSRQFGETHAGDDPQLDMLMETSEQICKSLASGSTPSPDPPTEK